MKSSHPPIVMIHGAFCGGWVFDDFRKPFADQGYEVHAPTLRFHDRGDDPPPELAGTGIKDFAEDLRTEIAALGQPPVLIGHSMGGLLAQMLAVRIPVRAAVLLAPSPPWGVLPSTVFELATAAGLYMAGEFWSKIIRPNYDIAATHALDQLSPLARKEVFARFVPESGRATFEVLHWAMDSQRASWVDAGAIVCPILCLAGQNDSVNPPATVRRVAQRYRGWAHYEELENHSHWVIGEPGWEKIAERMIRWLDDKLMGASQEAAALAH
jgi:non-heme chloroperoxidase